MNEVRKTVAEIYSLIRDYCQDVRERLPNSFDIARVFDVVRGIKYVPDSFAGYTEVLKRPGFTLRDGGDCDDKTIVAGSWFLNKRIPFRVVTTSHTPSGEMQHVYLEYLYRGTWMPFDATYSHNKLHEENSYTRKIVWENPMIKEFMRGAVSLAGIGDTPGGDSKNFYEEPSFWVKVGEFFSGIAKTATKHMDYREAKENQKAIWNNVNASWFNATSNERQKMYDDSVRFIAWAKTAFSGWWNDAMNVLYNAELDPRYRNDRQYMTGYNISLPYLVIYTQADKDSDMTPLVNHLNWIFQQVTRTQVQYTAPLETIPGTDKGIPGTGTVDQKVLSSGIGWLAPVATIGGLWFVASRSKLKGRK